MTKKPPVTLAVLTALIFASGLLLAFFLSKPITQDNSKQIALNIDKAQTPSAEQNLPKQQSEVGTLVTRVIDGDTIEIEGGQRIRYIGIDTPETVHPDIKTECYGISASNKNKELVEGKRVVLEKDVSETDKYGRMLRYVYIGDLFVNDFLVREGFANSSSYPPDIKYQDLLNQAEAEAHKSNKGLWGNCGESAQESTRQDGCDIKGNISTSGEKIYHVPGQRYYERTVVDQSKGEKWFCTEAEAQKEDFRKSKT